MTDARVSKLVSKGLSAAVATDLVDAGYDSPADIRGADDEDIETAVGSEYLAAVRAVFPAPQEEE